MARFFARFDSGSAGWESGFAAGLTSSAFFDRLRISTNSASAALLRNGLIASRSLLSADIYADLDDVNEDGSKGTYFPPDLLSTDSSTYVSWSSAYTSSVEGIKTPTSNTYGTGNVNYSLRVTASILSSSNLVGRTTPIDPVGASYTAYINASNAVKAVLDTAQTGNGTLTTPYVRTGNNPSRTLHSIWHDPDLQYFGWDDFTPGAPALTTATDQAGYKTSGPTTGYCTGDSSFCGVGSPLVGFTIRVNWTATGYANDTNPNGFIDVTFNWENSPLVPPGDTSVLASACTADFLDGNPRANGTFPNFYQDYVVVLATDPPATILGDFLITASYRDPLITSSRGPYAYTTVGINLANPCAAPPGPPPPP